MISESKKYLNDLSHLLTDIEQELAGIGYSDFINNRKLIIKTVEKIEDLIDFVKKLPVEFKNDYINLNLPAIENLNEKLINSESGVNDDEAWHFCKREIIKIRKSLQAVIH